MHEESIVAIVSAVVGSGGFGGFMGWVLQRMTRRGRLEDHVAEMDIQLRDIKLIVLRQCIFNRPRDRNSHEFALKSGDEYLRLGGNGVGHIRYDQLKHEYEERVKYDDWDYSHMPQPKASTHA